MNMIKKGDLVFTEHCEYIALTDETDRTPSSVRMTWTLSPFLKFRVGKDTILSTNMKSFWGFGKHIKNKSL